MEVRPVHSNDELTRFVECQRSIYETDSPRWTLMGEDDYQVFYGKAAGVAAQGFLVTGAGRVLSRGAAILNRQHLKKFRDDVGFFGFFDTCKDPRVIKLLLGAIENQLRVWGCSVARGPVSPTMNKYPGLLIEGHEKWQSPFTSWTPTYIAEIVESAGYKRCKDLLAFEVTNHQQMPHLFTRTAENLKRLDISIRSLSFRRFDEEIREVWKLYEEQFRDNWGEIPIPEEEFVTIIHQLRWLVPRSFVQLAQSERNIVGFIVAMPDVTRLNSIPRRLASANQLLREFGRVLRSSRVRVPLLTVHRDYRNRGIDAALVASVWRECLRRGVECAELSWILEDNRNMLGHIRRTGAIQTKKWRLYEKSL